MPKDRQPQNEMLKGTLDMMILRTLVSGDAHGHTIAKVIEHTSEDLLQVEQGSLYPAAPARGPEMVVVLLGCEREQSQCEVLSPHAGRP
jgi:hypothetical protein